MLRRLLPVLPGNVALRLLVLAVVAVGAVGAFRVDHQLTTTVTTETVRYITVQEPVILELPGMAAPAPALAREEAEPQTQTATAAIEAQRFYGTADMLDVLAHTPWDVSRWDEVLSVMSCEARSLDDDYPGTVDVESVGDQHLVPFTGPSLGPAQINISANAHLARTFDGIYGPSLQTAWGGALAMYIKWLERGRSFQPWSVYPECTAEVEALRGE